MTRLPILSALLGAALLLQACCATCDTCEEPASPNTLTDAERAAGWELLFDGATTAGWRGFRGDAMPDGWTVADGTLARTGGGGDIVTVEAFGDFELRLQWKISEAGNSGIFFRVSEEQGGVYETGPEMQVLDDARHPDGQSRLTSAGSNYALHAAPEGHTAPVGQWNDVLLRVDGAHVEHWLNGTKVVEYDLWTPEWTALVAASKFSRWPGYGLEKTGHIALQDHGDPVWYRDIKVRRLE